jgi:hypothetical protein
MPEMSDNLDDLFARIRSGKNLLSQIDQKLLLDHFIESKIEARMDVKCFITPRLLRKPKSFSPRSPIP